MCEWAQCWEAHSTSSADLVRFRKRSHLIKVASTFPAGKNVTLTKLWLVLDPTAHIFMVFGKWWVIRDFTIQKRIPIKIFHSRAVLSRELCKPEKCHSLANSTKIDRVSCLQKQAIKQLVYFLCLPVFYFSDDLCFILLFYKSNSWRLLGETKQNRTKRTRKDP